MFGGLCMPKRNTIAANCSDIFEQSNAPGQLFVLELNPVADFDATTVNVRPTWKKVNTINETLERSFHTATFIESLQSIVVLGVSVTRMVLHLPVLAWRKLLFLR